MIELGAKSPTNSRGVGGGGSPYLNPHFYHEMREANLLVMLGMLAGHAGDVENDADDVDRLA